MRTNKFNWLQFAFFSFWSHLLIAVLSALLLILAAVLLGLRL